MNKTTLHISERWGEGYDGSRQIQLGTPAPTHTHTHTHTHNHTSTHIHTSTYTNIHIHTTHKQTHTSHKNTHQNTTLTHKHTDTHALDVTQALSIKNLPNALRQVVRSEEQVGERGKERGRRSE